METASGGLAQIRPAEPATLGPHLVGPSLSARHLLTPSAGLQATGTHTGPTWLTGRETKGLGLPLENRLLRPKAGPATGPPLRFSQTLSPKLPRTLCTVTSPLLTLLCPLPSPSLTTGTEQTSPGTEHLRQQEAGFEDSVNEEQWVRKSNINIIRSTGEFIITNARDTREGLTIEGLGVVYI